MLVLTGIQWSTVHVARLADLECILPIRRLSLYEYATHSFLLLSVDGRVGMSDGVIECLRENEMKNSACVRYKEVLYENDYI